MIGTCLITGGAGFIGCAVSQRLCLAFDRVVALDVLHPQVHASSARPTALAPGVELVLGDVTCPETWNALLSTVHPDVVLHLAAETGTGQSLTEASRHASVNVVGTTQMLDAFARHQQIPRRIVLSSSRAVYGEGAWSESSGNLVYPGPRPIAMLKQSIWDFPGLTATPFDAANVHANPSNIYAATKLAQEHILNSWSSSFGTEISTLRLQNVYGPGQSLRNSYTGIVSYFAQIARRREAIPVYEDGNITRDFVFIDDVARVLEKVAVEGVPSSLAYDIGSGTATTILELGRLIAARYEAPEPVVNNKFRPGDVRHASCSIDRACSDLGYKPQWPLKQGLDQLCKWIDEQMAAAPSEAR